MNSVLTETFPSDEGVEFRVFANDNGTYNVVLFDTDAEQSIPARVGFKTLEAAKAYAHGLATRFPVLT